jgi:hypothetical protein
VIRRLAPTLVLLTIAVPMDYAKAFPLGSCRPAPWFRDFDPRSFPIVCGDWWGSPRYYYFAMSEPHRHYHRTR